MDNLAKLVRLLSKYIEINKTIEKKYESNKTLIGLYEELFYQFDQGTEWMIENSVIGSIIFDTIYGNSIYYTEFYKLLLAVNNGRDERKEYRQFVSKIKYEYRLLVEETNEIDNQIRKNKAMVMAASRAKFSIDRGLPLNRGLNDDYFLKKIVSFFEISGVISNREELLLINEIELYNRRVSLDKAPDTEIQYVNNLYEQIPNILDAGYQEHDKIEVDPSRGIQLDKFIKEIYDFTHGLGSEETISTIEEYKKYNIDEVEYNYIVVGLLDNYLDELLTFYRLLIDKEVYSSRKDRLTIVREYYVLVDKYLALREYYMKINEVNEEEFEEPSEETDDTLDNFTDGIRVIYSRSTINPLKAYLIEDMGDIPYEYYETVYDLIKRFKRNDIYKSEIKKLSGKKDTSELRHDQVRIIFKHLRDDIYCIKAVFVKKCTNNALLYSKLASRNEPDISTEEKLNRQLELSAYNERQLEELVREKGRKGTR